MGKKKLQERKKTVRKKIDHKLFNFKEYYTRSRRVRIDDLPLEVLQKIFSYLSHRDLYQNVRHVSKHWAKLGSSCALWNVIYCGSDITTDEVLEWLKLAKQLKALLAKNRHDAGILIKQVMKYHKSIQKLSFDNCWASKEHPTIPGFLLCNLLIRCPYIRSITMTGCKILSCKFFRLLGGELLKERLAIKRYKKLQIPRKALVYYGPVSMNQLRAFVLGKHASAVYQILDLEIEIDPDVQKIVIVENIEEELMGRPNERVYGYYEIRNVL